MSDPLRIALVVEGATDLIVIEAALNNLLPGRTFVLTQLQPQTSVAFGPIGTGWSGVYKWCHQAAAQGAGALRNNPLFDFHDVLVLHLDAEVADETYSNGGIVDPANDLPCSQPCPPPSDTTNALRVVLLRWAGEVALPPMTVLCTPSKCTEAWVLVGLYPHDALVASGNVECAPCPVPRLQLKPIEGRLIRSGKKSVTRYRDRASEITAAWPAV